MCTCIDGDSLNSIYLLETLTSTELNEKDYLEVKTKANCDIRTQPSITVYVMSELKLDLTKHLVRKDYLQIFQVHLLSV